MVMDMETKQNYARLDGDRVIEAVQLPMDTSLEEIYPIDFCEQFIKAPAEIEQGWTFIDKKWVAPIIEKISLEDLKSDLKRQIDEQAETERLKYITPGVGQSMTYTEKVNQASNYAKAYAAHLNDPENIKAPNENEYLLLKSSLGIDGDTLAEVAENITWAYALWEQVGAAIETIRLKSKALIDACETTEEAQAIFDAVKWPTP